MSEFFKVVLHYKLLKITNTKIFAKLFYNHKFINLTYTQHVPLCPVFRLSCEEMDGTGLGQGSMTGFCWVCDGHQVFS